MSEAEEQGRLKSAEREVCRYCGRTLRAADPDNARLWPFCSERCKMAELGMWFQDRYVLSRPVGEVADDAGSSTDAAATKKPPKDGGKAE